MRIHPALSQTRHRPWPLPERPWLLQQVWRDLLFLHWEMDVKDLRPLIPASLDIDTFDGKAWIAVVPFSMQGVAPRACPKPKSVSDFPEINIRTYVVKDGMPGVWFFSLDIPNRLPVWIARRFFHLPYFLADMTVQHRNNHTYYRSDRRDRSFEASFHGLQTHQAVSGSFETWASERYCFYAQSDKGKLYRAEVQHPQWPLMTAQCEIHKNSMLDAFPVGEQHSSILYSKSLPVVAWLPQRIG
ncbi:DUF2071 domain-containing protein [Pelagicoccus sp. NFK12]|uniref:DUF2071 domain-containing protein n=1 Tax=Pelagicoccus enzymogenes TaxID=2773457 RepID=A0A927F649_9BACT|nr:DUF2071 domain-containing protein [Pelagicoccus enzymogenes]MBD5778912.1 DUF2071 domain-containing protein [Pelagicoccus enzymogenes]MDQ8197344.1 DUF2071 domain-containing protein [Pelagicoccus enzymogenes]